MNEPEVILFYCPFCKRKTGYLKQKTPWCKPKKCKGCGKIFSLTEETRRKNIQEMDLTEAEIEGLAEIGYDSALLPEVGLEGEGKMPTPSQVMREEKKTLKAGFDFIKTKRADKSKGKFEPGEMFGEHYCIERTLGQGGMGIVYQATDLRLDRLVALKLILPKGETTSKMLERFLLEARSTAQIQHPSIVEIYEVGEKPMPYFTMEFIEGDTLKDWIRKNPKNYRSFAKFFKSLAEALENVHEKKIIHRDIKPANIMIDKNNNPKLMDFGLAKNRDIQKSFSQPGDVVGTLAYMSPEQAQGEEADGRSDVYSMGAALYECLTLRLPFDGNNYGQIWNQVVHENPVNPQDWNPEIPKELEAICLKCLEKSPEKRYQTSRELAHDMENYLENRTVMATPVTLFTRLGKCYQRKKGWSLAIGAVCVAILVCFTVALLFWQWIEAQKQKAKVEKEKNEIIAQEETRRVESLQKLQKKIAEEALKAEEQRKLEETRLTETSFKVEEERKAEAQRKLEDERKAEAQRKLEDERKAETQRKLEDERKAEAQRKLEDERKAEAQRKLEDARYKLSSGIIHDTKTCLEWLVGPDQDTTWDEAKAWVESIDRTQYGTGWRLPTKEELAGIYEKGKGKCNIVKEFVSPRESLWVWSGELKGSLYAWCFVFHRGREYWPSRSNRTDRRAFAVRQGRQ